MTALNLGVMPDEIRLNLIGYTVQDMLFHKMSSSPTQDTLAMLALTCGLIGFVFILLAPNKMTIFSTVGWLFLVALIFARPLQELLFFTPLTPTNAPRIAQAVGLSMPFNADQANQVCPGGAGNPCGLPTYQDVAKDATNALPSWATGDSSSVPYAFTPELATVDILGQVNADIATSLLPIGEQTMDGEFSTIEALRRSKLDDPGSIRVMSDYILACGAKVPGSSDKLYMTPQALRHDKIWADMEKANFTAKDAYSLFNGYTHLSLGKGGNAFGFYPILSCPTQGCGQGYMASSDKNQFDQGVAFFMSELSPTSASDDKPFQKALTNPLDMLSSTAQKAGHIPGANGFKIDELDKMPVQLLVPLNFSSIEKGIAGQTATSQAGDLQNGNSQVNAKVDACSANGLSKLGGAGTAGAAAGAGTLLLTAVLGISLGPIALIGAGVVATASAVFGGQAVTNAGCYLVYNLFGAGDAPTTVMVDQAFGTKVGYVAHVKTCADLFDVTAARLGYSEAMANHLTQSIQDFIHNAVTNKGAAQIPSGYMSLPPEQAATLALKSQLGAKIWQCQQESGAAQKTCIQKANDDTSALIGEARALGTQNALPVAYATLKEAGTPVFVSGLWNKVEGWGQNMAGPFMWMKGLIGGFEAGTYAKIMPMICYFFTCIMLIITPLLYMLGLLLPFWSVSIIFIPIMVIAFLHLTLIEFTIVHFIALILTHASALGGTSITQDSFADIMLGTAYCSAFMITGAVLFSLRNPTAALSKVAGADGAATVGIKDVIEAGAFARIGYGVVKTVAGNALPVAGKMLGAAEIAGQAVTGKGRPGDEKGGALSALGSMVSTPIENARADFLTKYSEKNASAAYTKGLKPTDFGGMASGRYIKKAEGDMEDMARSRGFSNMNQSQQVSNGHGGMRQTDSMTQTLKSMYQKAGLAAGEAFLNSVRHLDGKGLQLDSLITLDKDAKQRGSVVYNVSAEGKAALQAGGLTGERYDRMRAAFGKNMVDTADGGLAIIEHRAHDDKMAYGAS